MEATETHYHRGPLCPYADTFGCDHCDTPQARREGGPPARGVDIRKTDNLAWYPTRDGYGDIIDHDGLMLGQATLAHARRFWPGIRDVGAALPVVVDVEPIPEDNDDETAARLALHEQHLDEIGAGL